MAYNDTITLNITGYGTVKTTSMEFDNLIARYLPASVHDLRLVVLELAGEGCEGHESTNGPLGNVKYCDGSCTRMYQNLHTVTECLMAIAELRDGEK